MVKPVFRRKSIGTKVSEEEYARLEALAGGRAMSEWAREVLLRELDGRQARPADETLLAEVLALRTILLNASAHPANPQSWNRYAYTFNNPLKFIDVEGKCSSPAVGQGQVGICVDLYISSRTINTLGLGDNRGPRSNGGTYRVEMQFVVDPKKGSVTMTKNDAGVSKAIVPLPPMVTVIGNKGTSDTNPIQPTTDDKGTTHFNVSNEALNGLSMLPGAPKDPIKTSLDLEVTQEGKVGVEGGLRTAYPSLEIWSYDENGKATPILQIQENKPDDLKRQDQEVPNVEPK